MLKSESKYVDNSKEIDKDITKIKYCKTIIKPKDYITLS